MNSHPFPNRRPAPSITLIVTVMAALMILTWWAAREAGKFLAARSRSSASGMTAPSSAAAGGAGKIQAASAGETATPEETEALLKTTLEAFRDYENVPSNTFNGHWRRARLVSKLAGLSTPKLLSLADALMAEGSREAEEMAGRLLGPILTPRDPARIWSWLRDGAAANKPNYVRFLSGTGSIFSEWAKRDPQAALAAWQADVQPLVREGKVSAGALGGIYQSWAETDPAAAFSALEKISNPAERQQLAQAAASSLQSLFQGEASTWPSNADTLINRMLSLTGNQTPAGMESIMRARLARQTPQETAAWADTLSATPEQRALIDQTLADPWMSRDPASAANWYVDRVTARDPALRGEALERSIRHWTKAGDQHVERYSQPPPDLAAASEWLIAQGLNTQSQAAMSTLARAWVEAREPEAALAWAQALPDPTARAEALQTVTQEIRQRFPNDWQRLTQSPPSPESPAK